MNERGYRFRNRRGARVEFGVETVRTITNNVLLYSGYVVPRRQPRKPRLPLCRPMTMSRRLM